MTLIMLTATTVPVLAGASEQTDGRSTGNESVSADVSGVFYERGNSISVTVMSTNLDPSTEYTINWELCFAAYNNCNLYSEMAASGGSDPTETEGTMDLGSGNMFTTSVFTFTDPGLFEDDGMNGISGIMNQSYHFRVTLDTQGIELETIQSSAFVLGGEMRDQSYIDNIGNLLKNTPIEFNGRIYFDYENQNLLDYGLDCSLYEGASTTAVDTYSIENITTSQSYVYFYSTVVANNSAGDELLPLASSGIHRVECSLMRNIDATVMGTMVSNDFSVIDADVTGLEEIHVDDLTTVFYERSTTATPLFTVSMEFTDMYVGETYTADWELCFAAYNNCNLYSEMAASGNTDPTETEGQFSFTPTTSTITQTFDFTDPGLFEDDGMNGISGIMNQSYHFRVILNVQGVELDVNQSSAFVLGGEMRGQSYIDNIGNLLKNTPIEFNGRIYFDYENQNLLDYGLDCSLYEGASTTAVDTYSIENITTSQSYVYFYSTVVANNSAGDELLPLASSGIHRVECSLMRNIDATVMGTMVSNDFSVIDADVTGLEEIHVDDLTTVFYERSTTATPLFTVSMEFTDMYVGETYTADWELCFAAYNNCNLYSEMAASGNTDPTETEGQFSFTPTTSTITQTFDFTDPGLFEDDGMNGISGIMNQSYHFRVILNVQGVELDVNQSSAFVLGGEMRDQSYIDNIGNLLKNTPIEFNGRFYLDYENQNLMDYDLDCGLYEGTSTTPIDTYSIENINFYYAYNYFNSNGGNSSTPDLIATSTTGTHHIECALTRNIDGTVMGRIIGGDFQVIDDTANQDDATITVTVDIHADHQYGNITIVGADLDAGQEYKYNWIVHDNVPIPPVTLMQNDYIWVQGNGGSDVYMLEFHDLPDTANACFSVTFSAGDTELETVSGICWNSASTSDFDGDGVYDKDDICDDTPAGSIVQADGCSDGDGDGFDSFYETDCGSDPNDANSVPTDYDNDGTCDLLDADADGDGFLNEDEILAGTLPLDETSFPANRLPTCSLYYSLEADGMPTSFEGDAVIPALSGVTAQAGIDSIVPSTVTIPSGSYFITAHCIDLDGDDITVTVNDITIGPVAGEVSAAALIVIGENVSETVDVTITWTDGSDTLMTMVTIEMESDSTSIIPGFGVLLGLSALLLAGLASRRKHEN